MHIRSVVVRNYRVHRELSVAFDRKLTLIGGPNEVGKSTLAEAIHRGLFLKSKVTGEALSPMKSNVGEGAPEVEVEFQKNDAVYRVHKKFNGTNGTTRLSQVNGKTWQGDEAESRLADILGVEQVVGGKGIGERVGQQWAHLWVWQGQSGADPSTHATSQQESLLSRLQNGSAVVMQSELDSKIAKSFSDAVAAAYTQKRDARPKTALSQAMQDVKLAGDAFRRSEEQCSNLKTAADDFRLSGQHRKDADALVKTLQSDLAVVNNQLELVTKLGVEAKQWQSVITQEAQKITELEKAECAIHEAERELKDVQDELLPTNSNVDNHAKAEKDSSEAYTEANRNYEVACETATQTLGKSELATVVQNHVRVSADLHGRIVDQSAAEEIRQKTAKVEAELSALPVISDTQIRRLRSLSQDRGEADATLKAIATGIELVAADQSILVGGKELLTSAPLVISEVTEICIGSGVRLLIRPGGGDGVTAVTQKLQEIALQLRQELVLIGVTSSHEAEQIFEKRQELTRQIDDHGRDFRALNGDTLSGRITSLTLEQQKYAADIERRIRILNLDLQLPEVSEDVDVFVAATKLARDDADTQVQKLKRGRDEADEKRRRTTDKLNKYKGQLQQLLVKEQGVKGKLDGLIRIGGDAKKQQALLTEHEKNKAAAAEQVAEREEMLRRLEPDDLGRNKSRLERAIGVQQAAITSAGETQAVARHILESQGVTDPQEQLAFARAKLAEAEERLQNEERQGKAKLLLSDLFQAEQQKHSARFTQPLVTKIADYLRPVFGRSIDVQLNNENLKFTGLGLNRRDNDQGAVDFDSLSAGAREQLAAAVRLAIAELLAEGSDGCLPVVFDDAFAYSDPVRVEALQAMLDLAANRGLQVIVLTCNPLDYYRLGASEVALSAPAAVSVGLSGAASIIKPVSTADPFQQILKGDGRLEPKTRIDRSLPNDQSPVESFDRVGPTDLPRVIPQESPASPVILTPANDDFEEKPIAVAGEANPVAVQPSPVAPPRELKGAGQTPELVTTGPDEGRLIEQLRSLGGTAAKSALRKAVGMSIGDFSNLLQDLLRAERIQEDQTKTHVSLTDDHEVKEIRHMGTEAALVQQPAFRAPSEDVETTDRDEQAVGGTKSPLPAPTVFKSVGIESQHKQSEDSPNDADYEELLDELQQRNGASSKPTLKQALGWSDQQLNESIERLLRNGRIRLDRTGLRVFLKD